MNETTCPVHGCELVPGLATIRYGLPDESAPEVQADRRFPYARVNMGGGCMIGGHDPIDCAVRYCPQCRDERTAWLKAKIAEKKMLRKQRLFCL